MFLFIFSMCIAILSVTSYQILQKSIAPTVNPVVSLIITYAVALIFSFCILPFFPIKKSMFDAFRDANWASYFLGIVIFGIEIGFLLVYRTGWKMTAAPPTSMAITTVLLALAGVILFRESLSFIKLTGILLCIAGAIMINV